MNKIILNLDSDIFSFYQAISVSSGKKIEDVLCDALFLFAGKLSLDAIQCTHTT